MAEVPRDKLSNFTGIALGALGALAIVGVGVFVFPHTGDTRVIAADILILIGVVVLLLLLLLAWKWFVKLKDKPFTQKLKQSAGATPNELTAVATRAKLDDLRRTFDAGIAKFKATGKDLYKLPWYLLVGEPGAGKTEAVRHSNLPFPPGLQDFLQGTGGTVNMNWWLTNQAVILDTAGRYMFEELQAGTAAEWTEFLRLLLKYRPQCPINGLILVIPANSLILDTADQIEAKAGKIAQQLDRIQRVLEVRFPVYVIVTKCDLVNGFREFFENLDDPQLQHQIMGWSNPDPLDEMFNPELVEEHLKKVHDKLSERRLGLLLDPVAHAGTRSLRIDEVDSLYSFPDSFQKLGTRLRRYLALVFVAGEWSPKPLFLRGIYFTSSMREGQALDAELAELLHVPIESLRERRVWERERAYFLRDVLLKKAFPEKGLVTRAPNTRKAERGRTTALLTAGFAAAIAILGFSVWGHFELTKSIDEEQKTFWSQVNQSLLSDSPPDLNVLAVTASGARSNLSKTVTVGDQNVKLGEFYETLNKWADRTVEIRPIFKPAALLLDFGKAGDINTKQKEDAGKLYSANVLSPLVVATRKKIEKMTRDSWDEPATTALTELIRFECGRSPDVRTLFAFVTSAAPGKPGTSQPATLPVADEQYVEAIEKGSTDFCRPTAMPPTGYWALVPRDGGAIEAGVKTLIEYCEVRTHGVSSEFAASKARIDKLVALQKDLDAFCVKLKSDPPKTVDAYTGQRSEWTKKWELFAKSFDSDVRPLLKRLGDASAGQSLADLYRSEQKKANLEAAKAMEAMYREFPADRPDERPIVPRKPREDLQVAIKSFSGRNDESLLAGLSSLDSSLMGIVASGQNSRRIAEIVFDAYSKANSAMPSPSASDTRAAIVVDVGDITPPPAAGQAAAGTPEAVKVATNDAQILREYMAVPYRNYESVLAQVNQLPDQSTIAQLIRDKRDNRPHTPRPVIPFYAPDSGNFDPNYDADAAKQVVTDAYHTMAAITAGIEGKDSARVLDAPRLKQDLSSRKRWTDQYVDQYVTYWASAFPTVGEKPQTWSDFRGKLPDPDGVNPQWKQLAATIGSSLSWLSDVSPPDKRRQDAIDRANRIITAYNDDKGTLERIRTIRKSWISLDRDNIGSARNALLNKSAADVLSNYIWTVDGDDLDRYWKDITLSLLKTLASQPDPLANEFEGAKYDGFPLRATATTEISADILNQVRLKLESMALWGGGGVANPETVRGGKRVRSAGSEQFDEYLDLLARGGLTDTQFQKLGRMFDLVEALPRPGQFAACSVEVPTAENFNSLQQGVQPSLQKAADQWSDFTLSVNGANRDKLHRHQSHVPGFVGNIPWPGSLIEFDFYRNPEVRDLDGDPLPIGRGTQINAWQCLYLLARFHPIPAGAEDKPNFVDQKTASSKWYVRLDPEFGQEIGGQRKHFAQWILLKFEKPIPHPLTWPN